jgi:nitrate reductase NapE component
MKKRSAKRKRQAALAVFIVLALVLHSVVWAAFVTALLYMAWSTRAHRSGDGYRIGHRRSPVYIPEARLTGRKGD